MMTLMVPNALFRSGQVVMTATVRAFMDQNLIELVEVVDSLVRHLSGDWGDLDSADKRSNDSAVRHDERVLSAYQLRDRRIWIITEADRSSTCVLIHSPTQLSFQTGFRETGSLRLDPQISRNAP